MKRIAVILADLFEDSEYLRPVEAFQAEGHGVISVGLKAGATVKGKKQQTPVQIDKAVTEASSDDFDALLIPGGFSPDQLRADDAAVAFVKQFVESNKPVFTICHGPQLLISADVIRGRNITGWKSIIPDIKNAGANFVDETVVQDGSLISGAKKEENEERKMSLTVESGNLVSSRDPGDMDAFIAVCLKKLEQN